MILRVIWAGDGGVAVEGMNCLHSRRKLQRDYLEEREQEHTRSLRQSVQGREEERGDPSAGKVSRMMLKRKSRTRQSRCALAG